MYLLGTGSFICVALRWLRCVMSCLSFFCLCPGRVHDTLRQQVVWRSSSSALFSYYRLPNLVHTCTSPKPRAPLSPGPTLPSPRMRAQPCGGVLIWHAGIVDPHAWIQSFRGPGVGCGFRVDNLESAGYVRRQIARGWGGSWVITRCDNVAGSKSLSC